MDTIGGNAAGQLKAFVARIERIEEEKAELSEDLKSVYAEAKSMGFDTKILRALIRERKQDADEREEREALLDTYRAALGMLADTPLGQAALRQNGDQVDLEEVIEAKTVQPTVAAGASDPEIPAALRR